MKKLLIKRLLHTASVLFGVLLITFILFNVIGADVSAKLAGAGASARTEAETAHEYGFDKPLFFALDSQFVMHLRNAVTFRFGTALDGEPIIEKLSSRLPYSLSLTLPIFASSLVISVIAGILCAYFRGSFFDRFSVFVCSVGMSVPMLGFVIFGQYIFTCRFRIFPVYYQPDVPIAELLILPVLIGLTAGLAGNIRFYRAVMLDQIQADHIQMCFARGLSITRILFRHVLKNAMVPIITRVVMTVPYLFLGSFLLERFFGIPGLGSLMLDAVSSRDYFLINALTYIFSLVFVLCNLLGDLLCCLADARIRIE